MKTEFFDRFSKEGEISNFMKIRLVGTHLLHAGGHDESNSRLRSSANAPKNKCFQELTPVKM